MDREKGRGASMGSSGELNPFVRRFMIRHWRQQRQLTGKMNPIPPQDEAQEILIKDKNVPDVKAGTERVIFFISDE